MSVLDFFKTIPSKDPQDIRQYIEEHDRDTYTLLDVRQPQEYERSHLPGARLMPLGELPDRFAEIDRTKPVILYCRTGRRSLSAAGMLIGAGFKDIMNMSGGMSEWEGLVATGSPQIRMISFPPGAGFEEMAALAWLLEEGARQYYEGVSHIIVDRDGIALFQTLARAEEKHKDSIIKIFGESTGTVVDDKDPSAGFSGLPSFTAMKDSGVMESGLQVKDALDWSSGKDLADILEMSMAFETNSYDLYIALEKRTNEEDVKRRLFKTMADEELYHLKQMAKLLDEKV